MIFDEAVEFRGDRLSHDDLVGRLRACDERGAAEAFTMGDLAVAAVPMGIGHTNNNASEQLRALADEAGIDYEVLYRRRLVAAAVPEVTRVTSVAWSAYREIVDATGDDPAERERLFALLRTPASTASKRWTVTAVRKVLGRRPTHPSELIALAPLPRWEDATAEDRAAMAYKAAVDPETRPIVREALQQGDIERLIEQTEEREAAEHGDQPTVSFAEVQRREREALAANLVIQFEHAFEPLHAFTVRTTAEALAALLVAERDADTLDFSDRVVSFVETWLATLRSELRRQAVPRLVGTGVA